MKDFRELKVWLKGHQLTLSIYHATKRFPKEELYGLTSQMRRSASSIPANIAEGCGCGSDPELGRFLQIAMGSACELEYHLVLARDLAILGDDEHQSLNQEVVEVKRMLTGFMQKLRADQWKEAAR